MTQDLAQRKRRGTDPKTLLIDKIADWGISIGGMVIVAAVLGIFVFIFSTILPLIKGSHGSHQGSFLLNDGPEVLQSLVDEHKEKAILLHADGSIRVLSLNGSGEGKLTQLSMPAKAAITSSWMSLAKGQLAFGLSSGKVQLAEAGFDSRFDSKQVRHQDPFVRLGKVETLDSKGKAIIKVARADHDESHTLLGLTSDQRVVLLQTKGKTRRVELPIAAQSGRATIVLMRYTGELALIGTDKGELIEFDLTGDKPVFKQALRPLPDGETIQALAWPIGEQSIIVGGSKGTVLALARLQKGDLSSYPEFHRFESLGTAVSGISVSQRDKTFAVAGSDGKFRLYYLTGDRSLMDLSLPSPARPESVLLTPKGDGLFSVAGRQAHLFNVVNPHPETTLKTLFGKVWYEGYEAPDYVWQSTGGSDDFESKFSLTPLIYGTLKGTFYALLFAVPLAILAAIYTSQFMSRRLKAIVKPGIEIMAALPSVVMGFLAALLLAPLVEKHLFSIVLAIFGLPLFALSTLFAWRAIPRKFTKKIHEDNELWILVLGLAAGFALIALMGHGIEKAVFVDFKLWLNSAFGVNYDQRNSLVVGFAMGFAVIPVIFTICEDSLSSVPRHLISASLSCGATPWQTAVRVVLPVALSGIFSAVMIGFGRAVGETMIVLMATGNTPVMDMSMFNGFRALSANIAVEIPEAPVGGTLYRVLFLAAMVLFVMTFIVNTIAELVRLHLRRKYSQL